MIIDINPTGTLTVSSEISGQIDSTATKQQDHVGQALSRLIEYWKNKPDFIGWQADYQKEIAVLENAIWQVILLRAPDNAGTYVLDVLGRIVGQPRDGLDNASFLARIKARIRANSSFGHGSDVIDVIKLMTPSTFHFSQDGIAAFRIDFTQNVTASTGRQIPAMLDDTAAAGVGVTVAFQTSAITGNRYGSVLGSSVRAQRYSSVYDGGTGHRYGHARRL